MGLDFATGKSGKAPGGPSKSAMMSMISVVLMIVGGVGAAYVGSQYYTMGTMEDELDLKRVERQSPSYRDAESYKTIEPVLKTFSNNDQPIGELLQLILDNTETGIFIDTVEYTQGRGKQANSIKIQVIFEELDIVRDQIELYRDIGDEYKGLKEVTYDFTSPNLQSLAGSEGGQDVSKVQGATINFVLK